MTRYPDAAPVLTQPSGRRVLNPTFVEALMDVPPGWTKFCDCPGACGCNRVDRLRLLGNGVVAAQGALALRMLLERLGVRI